jgi:hypothetical protein
LKGHGFSRALSKHFKNPNAIALAEKLSSSLVRVK